MKTNRYLINSITLWQWSDLEKVWICINSEAEEFAAGTFAEEFAIHGEEFYEDFDAEYCEDAYALREFVEESAQSYLVNRDNGGLDELMSRIEYCYEEGISIEDSES